MDEDELSEEEDPNLFNLLLEKRNMMMNEYKFYDKLRSYNNNFQKFQYIILPEN